MLARLFITVVMVLGFPVLCPATISQQGQVEGDVVQMFPTVIVIRDDRGHTVLQLNPPHTGGRLIEAWGQNSGFYHSLRCHIRTIEAQRDTHSLARLHIKIFVAKGLVSIGEAELQATVSFLSLS
jgi:hypothetical protein